MTKNESNQFFSVNEYMNNYRYNELINKAFLVAIRFSVGNRMATTILVVFLINLTGLVGDSQEIDENTVLILNSDLAVGNYLVAQTEFRMQVGLPTIEIDLGKIWKQRSMIERIINNQQPRAIYCIGAEAFQLASELAPSCPLIVSSVLNWKRFSSRENVFAIRSAVPPLVQLINIHNLFPKIQTIGVLYNPSFNQEWFLEAKTGGTDVGIDVRGFPVERSNQVTIALKRALDQVDAIWLTPDPTVIYSRVHILAFFVATEAAAKPVFAFHSVYLNFGAVMSISADIATVGRQAAGLVRDVVFKRPVAGQSQNPAGTEISIDIQKIRELKLFLNSRELRTVNKIVDSKPESKIAPKNSNQ